MLWVEMTVERRRIFYSYVDHFSLLWQNNQFLPIVLGIGRIPNSKSLDTSLVLMETPHYIIIAKNLHSSNICRKFRELRMHYDRDRFSKRESLFGANYFQTKHNKSILFMFCLFNDKFLYSIIFPIDDIEITMLIEW